MLIEIPDFICEDAEITFLHNNGHIGINETIAICKDNKNMLTYRLRTQRDCNLQFFNEPFDGYPQIIGKLNTFNTATDDFLLGFWMSSHSAFRALQANEEQGGQVAASAVPIQCHIYRDEGLQVFVDALKSQDLENGDTVVIADKTVAIATNRVIPRYFLGDRDPKFLSAQERRDLVCSIKENYNVPLHSRNILMIDFINDEEASLGAFNHNQLCYEISKGIYEKYKKIVDVVISDSDTGVDQGQPLIGFPTVGSTPLGSTAGLSVYETLRVSVLAEYVRGHSKHIPMVICKPSKRNRVRENIGSRRIYPGMIHISLEKEFHRGLLTSIYWEDSKND